MGATQDHLPEREGDEFARSAMRGVWKGWGGPAAYGLAGISRRRIQPISSRY
jgi:hypothetical protein